VADVRIDLAAREGSARRRAIRLSAWWLGPSNLLERFRDSARGSHACDWYRVLDAFLGVESEDSPIRMRFQALYSEFRSRPPAPSATRRTLHCRVQVRNDLPAHLVTFTSEEEIRTVDFILDLFRDRGYVEMQPATDWRSVGLAGKAHPMLSAKGAQVLVDAREAWQPLIASFAVNWVMRIQPEVLFFHASAVGIDDAGILIAGGKGAGKSTLSMALGAQGHDFLGDEIAAVRKRTLELEPFRRAVSIRPGPQAPQVEQLLKGAPTSTECFPDGTTRTRVEAGKLFPKPVARPRRLQWVFFLRGFADTPRAEPFLPSTADLHLLTPLPGTRWGKSPAAPTFEIAKLLSSTNCYRLHPGLPEETARLVESIVRTR
jgi:hypothetical protein